MKRITSALAGLLLASAQVFAADWVRNPAPGSSWGSWRIKDHTDRLGDPAGIYLQTPVSVSNDGGRAIITAHECRSKLTSVLVSSAEKVISFRWGGRTISAKVDGVRYELPVVHEPGERFFFMSERGHQLFRRAIREELPVKIAVPLYQKPSAVFEWTMKGGAAAWKEACPPRQKTP